jgi:hypothetical protein
VTVLRHYGDTFKTNVKQFASDLRQLSDELQQLRALHAGKVGGRQCAGSDESRLRIKRCE